MSSDFATHLFTRLRVWADRFPDRIAHQVASPGSTPTLSLTYRELLARIHAVAASVRHRLPGDGSPVVFLGHKEPEMLAGFLGAVAAGHPYIPLDDSLPAHRVEHTIAAASAAMVLTPAEIAALPASDDIDPAALPDPAPHAPFYIIFTSGSTGDPKGVVITAACLDAFLNWMLAEHAFTEGGETFLNQAPFSFDLSVMDLYLSLATAGTLSSLSRREIADFKRLYPALETAGITTWVSTPSFAQLCLVERTFAAARLPAMRRFLFCGETLLPETAARLLDRFPAAGVWNTYGPTEATVATTSVEITREVLSRPGPLPIGTPRPGTAMYLLDETGAPVAAESTARGEMVIAGPNVSPGYLAQPALTARSFFDTPDGTRAYRTGDWGRWQDGQLYFEGRQDGQIKLHGYRIELADIEANLLALPDVRACAVVPMSKHGAVQSLVAFVVPRHDLLPSDPANVDSAVDALRHALAERLPVYMLPRKFHLRSFLPLTANGKVDRRQLLAEAAGGSAP